MESKNDVARLVFESWKLATNHPRACCDQKRLRLIISRLTDGYTEDDLTMAAVGISVAAWNQGQNPDHRIYDSCELCFRDGDHVDRFIREAEQHIAREKAAAQHSKKIADEAIQRSATGEVYHANRESLLKLVRKA